MLLIDPPLEAYGTAEQVRGWIAELDELAEQYKDDEESLADIARARASAERALANRIRSESEG